MALTCTLEAVAIVVSASTIRLEDNERPVPHLPLPPGRAVSASTIRLEDTERRWAQVPAPGGHLFQRARSDLRILKDERGDGQASPACSVSASTIRLEDTERACSSLAGTWSKRVSASTIRLEDTESELLDDHPGKLFQVSASTIRLEDTERHKRASEADGTVVFQRARSDLRILKGGDVG